MESMQYTSLPEPTLTRYHTPSLCYARKAITHTHPYTATLIPLSAHAPAPTPLRSVPSRRSKPLEPLPQPEPRHPRHRRLLPMIALDLIERGLRAPSRTRHAQP